jgi:hypothetical protein
MFFTVVSHYIYVESQTVILSANVACRAEQAKKNVLEARPHGLADIIPRHRNVPVGRATIITL